MITSAILFAILALGVAADVVCDPERARVRRHRRQRLPIPTDRRWPS